MDETKFRQLAAQLRKPEGEDGIKTGNVMNRGNLDMNLAAIDALQAAKGDDILEIGMGNGHFAGHILSKEEGIRYTGYDYSPVMVEESVKNNTEWVAAGRAAFICGDAASTPFSNHKFNKIFTVNTVYFWEDAPKVLSELKRILEPGGQLLIALRPKRQMLQYPFTKYGFQMYSKEDITWLLEDNGFTVVNIRENKEPDFDMEEHTLLMEHLLVTATPA